MPHHTTTAGITRRRFLRGSAAAGAALVAIDALAGCANSSDGTTTSSPVVVSSDDATNVLDSYSQVDLALTLESTRSLSLGTVLHPSEGTWTPYVATGSSASPMAVAGALSVSSGDSVDVVKACITSGSSWVVYDARCSDSVYAWVELDYLTNSWKLYASKFSSGVLSGTPSTLWEGDSDYDPPPLCCSGSKVLWQVMPSSSGSKTAEHSFCYLWKAGDSSARSVVESAGRFATEPTVSGSTVTLSPRVTGTSSSSVYYGITAYSLDDDLSTTIDQLVLPASVKPFRAVRIGDEFAFAVEANYSSGGLLANMGYYVGHGSGPFVYLSREPAAGVTGTASGVYVIKSKSSYFVVDVPNETYSLLSASDRCVDYGEYPASVGESSSFVTYATVKDADTGYPSSVTMRAFAL